MKKMRIAGLDTIEYGDPSASTTAIFFHGYGASAEDLFSLASVNPNIRWLFPQGPINLSPIPFFKARAWFPVNIESLKKAASEKKHEDLLNGFSKELEQASSTLELYIQEIGCEINQLILGGFSQGGMLATHIALKQEQNLKGLVVLSGSLVNHAQWEEWAKKHAAMRFFQSHGKNDPILPFFLAERLHMFFSKHQLQGDFHSFDAGHTVPEKIVELLKAKLSTW